MITENQHQRYRFYEQSTTLDELIDTLGAEYRRDGEYHADCPYCGKPAKRGHTHFSFYEGGFNCFYCGNNGSLSALSEYVGLGLVVEWTAPRKPEKDNTPLSEKIDIAAFVESAHNHRKAYEQLHKVKPYIGQETFERFKFGYGQLPNQKTPRIIIPLVENGEYVGLRGRVSPDFIPSQYMLENGYTPDKYMFAKGSKTPFFNIDNVDGSQLIIITENNLDSAALSDLYHTINGLACTSISPSTGAATKPKKNRRVLDRLRDKHIILWFDNDSAGQLATQNWERALRGVAASVVTFEYATGDPEKCDVGDYLAHDYEQGTDRVGSFLRAYTAHQSPLSEYVFMQGAPDDLRTAILSIRDASNGLLPKHNAASMVYDVWTDLQNNSFITPDDPMTVDLMVKGAQLLGRVLSSRMAWIGLEQLVSIGMVSINLDFFSLENTLNKINTEKISKNSNAGRKPTLYSLIPKAKAIENLTTYIEACCFLGGYIEQKLVDKNDLKAIYQEHGLFGVVVWCTAIDGNPRLKNHLVNYLPSFTAQTLATSHSTIIPTHNPITGDPLPFIDNTSYIMAFHAGSTPMVNKLEFGKNAMTNSKAHDKYFVSAPTYRLIKSLNKVDTAPRYKELEIKKPHNVMGQINRFCGSVIADRGGMFGMQLIFRSRECPYESAVHPTIPIHGKSASDIDGIVSGYLRGNCRVFLQIRIGTLEWFEAPSESERVPNPKL